MDSSINMDEIPKQESNVPAIGSGSRLRYPLRSAIKVKEEKTTPVDASKKSAPKRGRHASSVSQSMNVLNLSGKEKSSAKPPRRLSNPSIPAASSASKLTSNITPISEIRAKRSVTSQGRSDTPASDVSYSGNRKRFNVLSSASYWLSQIKLSESAAKHSISLGFFKLGFEAGCEPIQRMRDELKAYARKHNLSELEELTKEVFETFDISNNMRQPQVSESISQLPDEGTRSSDDDVHSSSSTMGTGKLKPKSLNVDAVQGPTVAESAKMEINKKTAGFSVRTRKSMNNSSANKQESMGHNLQRKSQNAIKQGSKKDKEMMKKQGNKGLSEAVNPLTEEAVVKENKENMAASPLEEICSAEVI